jgi:hypothetical protein
MNFARKPSRKQTAHEWVDYLRESNGLGGILAKTEGLVKLKLTLEQALVKLDLEHLSSKIEPGWSSSKENALFLLVNNASIGNRLQQNLPSLINELQKLGVQCTVIQVKIKPAPARWEIKPRESAQDRSPARGFNEIAKKSWEDLLQKLAPDSELRKTVERLLRHKPK